MRYRVVITETAWDDLLQIAQTIAVENSARAETLLTEMHDRCLRLEEFPESHTLVPDPLKRGVRRAVHGNYLIFFRVRGSVVQVLHVLHGARDYLRLLFPEDER